MKPLQYKGYLGSVECDATENRLYGKILYVNDLITYEAETPAELQAAFEEAVDDYLATCEQVGKEPDKSFRGTFNIRMSPQLHKAVAMEAAMEETTLNEFISRSVAEKLAAKNETYQAVAEDPAEYKTRRKS